MAQEEKKSPTPYTLSDAQCFYINIIIPEGGQAKAPAHSVTSWSHAGWGKVALPRSLCPSPQELCPRFQWAQDQTLCLKLRTVLATLTENLRKGSAQPRSCRCAMAKPAGGREALGKMPGVTKGSAGLQPLPPLTAAGLTAHHQQGLLPCRAASRVLLMSKMSGAAPKPGNKPLRAVLLAKPADTEAWRCQLPRVPL